MIIIVVEFSNILSPFASRRVVNACGPILAGTDVMIDAR